MLDIIMPIPDYAPDISRAGKSRHGTPVAVWTYANEQGHPVCHVARYATPDGKLILPWVWARKDGREQWTMGMPPRPRPLFRLDRIVANNHSVPILLVEGEKAADAGACLFPTWITTTIMGGSHAVATADLTPLKGRTVILHPDHDQAGWQWCANMIHALREISVGRIMMLRMPLEWSIDADALVRTPTLLDQGDDLADWWARGWRAHHLVDLRKSGVPILWDIATINSILKPAGSQRSTMPDRRSARGMRTNASARANYASRSTAGARETTSEKQVAIAG